MKIFSSHRRRLEPKRRFGTRQFQDKIRQAGNYKRTFSLGAVNWSLQFWRNLGIGIFAILFYFLVISSYFVIADIKVSGNQQISTESIQNTFASAGASRYFFIKKNNYFLMS